MQGPSGGDVFDALERAHQAHLKPHQRAMLRRKAAGGRVEDIGEAFGYAERTVREKLRNAMEHAFVTVGIDHDDWAAGWWCHAHWDCCLKDEADG